MPKVPRKKMKKLTFSIIVLLISGSITIYLYADSKTELKND